MTKPVRPDEVTSVSPQEIPDFVITTFNELIFERWDGTRSAIPQEQIVTNILCRTNLDREIIFKRGWLNIENLYRQQGWEVRYLTPDWTDEFDPYFEFKKRTE